MKLSRLVALSATLGVILGLATTWTEFGWPLSVAAITDPQQNLDEVNRNVPQPGEPVPRAVVEHNEHDFGLVPSQSVSKHSFRIRNEGDAPLQLRAVGTSCSACTLQSLAKNALQPGETTDITVEYRAIGQPGSFRQTATVGTNDPRRSQISLTVVGTVTTAFLADPKDLAFTDISSNTEETATVKLLAFGDDPLHVEAIQVLSPESSPFFQVDTQPLPTEEVAARKAKSGQQLQVTVKPGLPLGPIQQTIRLTTNIRGYEAVVIPVRGNVTSDISLSGLNWNAEQGVLTLGVIKSSEGARRQLLVLVRGPHRHEVQVKVGECIPKMLHVTLGKPSEINHGAVVAIPMTIEIPRGSPSVNHLNRQQASPSAITLETSLPDAPQLRFSVRFAVEGAN